MPEPAVAEQNPWHDLQPLLDQEMTRLPDKYRAAIVLCDLEGKTRKEAAHQLGCPEGTIAARLARARVMLAKRLARHGLSVSGGVLAAVLPQKASACVPPSVVSSTIRAATLITGHAATGVISVKVAALTEGVMKTMLLGKLKGMTAILMVMAAFVGAVGLIYRSQATEPPIQQAQDKPKSPKTGNEKLQDKEKLAARELRAAETNLEVAKAHLEEAKARYQLAKNRYDELVATKDDKDKLQGTWQLVTTEFDGLRIGEGRPENKDNRLVIEKSSFTLFSKLFHSPNVPLEPEDVKTVGTLALHSKKNPKEITLTWQKDPWTKKKDVTRRGIYAIDDGTLKICFSTAPDAKTVPTDFSAAFGSKRNLLILRRVSATQKGNQGEKDKGQSKQYQ
jgi:RNA polymerase sigma-70 factor (ECF subfamily)